MISCESCDRLFCSDCDPKLNEARPNLRWCNSCKTTSAKSCELCQKDVHFPTPACESCERMLCFPYCSEPNPTFQNKLTLFDHHARIASQGCFLRCEKCRALHCWDCAQQEFEFCGRCDEVPPDGCYKAFCKDCHDDEINEVGYQCQQSLCDACYDKILFVCRICNETCDPLDEAYGCECVFCQKRDCLDCFEKETVLILEGNHQKEKQCENCQKEESQSFSTFVPKKFPAQI